MLQTRFAILLAFYERGTLWAQVQERLVLPPSEALG
jgi:hypothetical protein